MKLNTQLIFQGLTLAGHGINMFSGLVPAKYQPYVALLLALINAGLGWYAHYYNPDGTPAQAAWVAKLLILFLLLSVPTMAQSTDPFESGPPVQVTGAYSNVSTTTANGFEIEISRRFSQHFWGHLTYFEHATPGAKVAVAGPMYQYSLAHAFKNQSTFADLSKIDLFAKAGVGASHAEPCPTGGAPTCVDTINGRNPAFKFAFGVGGGFNYHVNNNLTVRPAEIEYFRTAIGGLTVKNYSQFISGLTVAFGRK